MSNIDTLTNCFTICPSCNGMGKKPRRLRKKARLQNQLLLDQVKNDTAAKLSKPHLEVCTKCVGSGLQSSEKHPTPDTENYPHVAIIGGGIGGVALAVACLHRGIPFTLYERDTRFEERSQGYGLTLQQASKAIEGFGIPTLVEGVVSTKHLVHTTDGTVIAEWGMRKWLQTNEKATPKRTNIHIARQSLRAELLAQLGGNKAVQWGYQLTGIHQNGGEQVGLTFKVGDTIETTKADLVVGADGIRSAVRTLTIGEEKTPLRYLDCMVLLGICPLSVLQDIESPLLDSATVFQTANGNERIYMMPYTADSIMWQLSFPMLEEEAQLLSREGAKALKEEAISRTQWHSPIPEIIAATEETQISGYPVYDRALLYPELLENLEQMTLIGDAAHPMSPFKGQGANQALLDALALARAISKGCKPQSNWKEKGIRKSVLAQFEEEMLQRSATKVKDSADAAQFLHSDIVLYQSDEPRGRVLKRKP